MDSVADRITDVLKRKDARRRTNPAPVGRKIVSQTQVRVQLGLDVSDRSQDSLEESSEEDTIHSMNGSKDRLQLIKDRRELTRRIGLSMGGNFNQFTMVAPPFEPKIQFEASCSEDSENSQDDMDTFTIPREPCQDLSESHQDTQRTFDATNSSSKTFVVDRSPASSRNLPRSVIVDSNVTRSQDSSPQLDEVDMDRSASADDLDTISMFNSSPIRNSTPTNNVPSFEIFNQSTPKRPRLDNDSLRSRQAPRTISQPLTVSSIDQPTSVGGHSSDNNMGISPNISTNSRLSYAHGRLSAHRLESTPNISSDDHSNSLHEHRSGYRMRVALNASSDKYSNSLSTPKRPREEHSGYRIQAPRGVSFGGHSSSVSEEHIDVPGENDSSPTSQHATPVVTPVVTPQHLSPYRSLSVHTPIANVSSVEMFTPQFSAQSDQSFEAAEDITPQAVPQNRSPLRSGFRPPSVHRLGRRVVDDSVFSDIIASPQPLRAKRKINITIDTDTESSIVEENHDGIKEMVLKPKRLGNSSWYTSGGAPPIATCGRTLVGTSRVVVRDPRLVKAGTTDFLKLIQRENKRK